MFASTENIFVGLNYYNQQKNWRWLSSDRQVQEWGDGYPIRSDKQRCGALRFLGLTYDLVNVFCLEKNYFICQSSKYFI